MNAYVWTGAELPERYCLGARCQVVGRCLRRPLVAILMDGCLFMTSPYALRSLS